MQSEFSIGTGPMAFLSPRARSSACPRLCWEGRAGTGCAVLPWLCVRPVLFCAGSSVGSVGLLPFPARCPGAAGGAPGVSSPAPPGGALQGLPSLPSRGAQLPAPCYSSYLFIEMSECGEVQKSKLAPERP